MAEPWKKYQQGPWQKYQGPESGGDERAEKKSQGGLPLAFQIGGVIADTLTGRNAFTGENRNPENLPELSRDGVELFSDKDALAFARGNPLAMAEIFKKRNPDAEIDFDEFGNVIAEHNGERFMLNRPGFSGQDVDNTLLDLVTFLGAARLGGVAGSPLGAVGRAVGAASATGGASVGLDQVAQVIGSEQPVDQKRAAVLALFGGGGELAAPLVERFIGRMVSSNALFRDGKLTEQGRKVAKQAGIEPEVVTPEFAELFSQRAAASADPVAAAKVARGESLPVPARLSRGQATGNESAQSFERQAQFGVRGEQAQTQARAFFDEQAQALKANEAAVVERVGTPLPEKGAGAQQIMTTLRGNAEQARKAGNAAFEAAKKSEAFLPRTVADEYAMRVRRSLKEGEFDTSAPLVKARVNELKALEKMPEDSQIRLAALDRYRRRIGNNIADASGSEKTALQMMKRELDRTVDDAFVNGLITGDQEAVAAWKNARALWAKYRGDFKADDVVQKLVEKDVTAEEAANLIFGASAIGSRQGAAQTINKIKGLVGENSEEWAALKGEALLKLFQRQSPDSFSAAKFVSDFDKFTKNNPTIYRNLFADQDRALLQQFRDYAKDTIISTSAKQASGSGLTSILAFQNMLGPAGQWLGRVLSGFEKGAASGVRASRTFNGVLEPKKLFMPGTVSGAAATAASNQ